MRYGLFRSGEGREISPAFLVRLSHSRCGTGSCRNVVLPTACASSLIAFDTRCTFAYWQWLRKIRGAGSSEEIPT